MTTADAVSHFGTTAKLAAALRIKPQAVYQWGQEPPMGRQFEIQTITKGKLKAASRQSA